MERIDYPVDVRADYPERSSRLWAVLTIFWIKFLAVIPHGIILIFLGIAQWVVAFIAQFVVAFKGEYPAGMHEFVTGVLRWQTRVTAFVLSVERPLPAVQPPADRRLPRRRGRGAAGRSPAAPTPSSPSSSRCWRSPAASGSPSG